METQKNQLSESPIVNFVADHDTGNSHSYFVFYAIYDYFNEWGAGVFWNAAEDPDTWGPPIIPPPLPYWYESSVFNSIFHAWDHYYNPDTNTSDGKNSEYQYLSTAHTYRYIDLGVALNNAGWASHYAYDLNNPMHTGNEIEQMGNRALHDRFESWIYFDVTPYYWEIWNDNNMFVDLTLDQCLTHNVAYTHQFLPELMNYVRAENYSDRVKEITKATIKEGSRCYRTALYRENIIG